MADPRVAFEFFGRPIQWYGVMFAGGFLAAVVHWAWLGKRTRRKPGIGSDLGLWIMLGGVIGARAAHVLSRFGYYMEHPGEILRVDQGGLIFYGGFVGGVTACVILSWFHRKDEYTILGETRRETTWSLGDFATTALPLGHAFGRIGCYLHGCCHGRASETGFVLPRKLFDDSGQLVGTELCYPVQLYEVAGLLAIYVLTTLFYLRNKIPGRVFAFYLIGYAMLRFHNEFYRGDERLGGENWFNGAQTTAIAFFLCGVALFAWFTWRARRVAAT